MRRTSHHDAVRTGRLAVAVAALSLVTALGAALPAGAATTVPPAPVTTTAPPTVDAVAGRLLARGARAVSLAVWRNGRYVVNQSWGKAEPSSRYQLASISKLLTAAAVHRLAAQGVVQLDGPVLPALRALGVRASSGWEGVTVRHLLTHTSGTNTNDWVFFGRWPARTCKAALDAVMATPPAKAPGTRYRYSNVNYCALGLYLEVVTGKSFDRAVYDLVLTPAGVFGPHLAKTGVNPRDDVVHPVTPGRRYLEPLGAAGQWVANPSEVVEVVASFSAAERAAFLSSLPVTKGVYGQGARLNGDGSWGHTGTLEASRTCVWVEPDGTIWSAMVAGRTPSSGSGLRDLFLPAVRALAA
jgi:D-alanyl-D-alanine carboxypeptidase